MHVVAFDSWRHIATLTSSSRTLPIYQRICKSIAENISLNRLRSISESTLLTPWYCLVVMHVVAWFMATHRDTHQLLPAINNLLHKGFLRLLMKVFLNLFLQIFLTVPNQCHNTVKHVVSWFMSTHRDTHRPIPIWTGICQINLKGISSGIFLQVILEVSSN